MNESVWCVPLGQVIGMLIIVFIFALFSGYTLFRNSRNPTKTEKGK